VSVNDPAPLVVAANGTALVVFTVTLSGPALVSGERASVHMASADYCSAGVSSLTRVDATLTFAAGGPRSQSVSMLVHFDPVDGAGHKWGMFRVRVSDPVGAAISKASGVGTIVDSPAVFDDPFFFDACLSKARWASLPS
jgi:hypothetical protein